MTQAEILRRVEELQRKANSLAIQESNLRAQIEPLELLRLQLAEAVKAKNQVLGAISALSEIAQQFVGGEQAD